MSVCLLPRDIYLHILSYLPPHERESIFPQVCKCWYQIASETKKNQTAQAISKLFANKAFTPNQIERMVHLIHPSLIYSLKKIKSFRLCCSYSSSPRFIIHKAKPDLKINIYFMSRINHCEYFRVTYNSKGGNLKINEKKVNLGNFKSRFTLAVTNSDYRTDSDLSPHFFLSRVSIGECLRVADYKKKSFFSWKNVDQSRIPDKLLIEPSLDFTVKKYIDYASHLNLSKLEVFSEVDSFDQLKCLCNENGVITQVNANSFSFKFELHRYVASTQSTDEEQVLHFLSWKANNSSDFYSLKMELCRAVFSKTTDKIAKKFGINWKMV